MLGNKPTSTITVHKTQLKIQKEIRLKVPAGQKKLRIDKYLAQHIENSSRTKIQKAIDDGSVLVNSKKIKSNYLVLPNDDIEIYLPKYEESPEVLPEDIKLDIAYEDEKPYCNQQACGNGDSSRLQTPHGNTG